MPTVELVHERWIDGYSCRELPNMRPFWLMVVFATVVGSVSGLATAAVLATINTVRAHRR